MGQHCIQDLGVEHIMLIVVEIIHMFPEIRQIIVELRPVVHTYLLVRRMGQHCIQDLGVEHIMLIHQETNLM
jgi:hypothetical protein